MSDLKSLIGRKVTNENVKDDSGALVVGEIIAVPTGAGDVNRLPHVWVEFHGRPFALVELNSLTPASDYSTREQKVEKAIREFADEWLTHVVYSDPNSRQGISKQYLILLFEQWWEKKNMGMQLLPTWDALLFALDRWAEPKFHTTFSRAQANRPRDGFGSAISGNPAVTYFAGFSERARSGRASQTSG